MMGGSRTTVQTARRTLGWLGAVLLCSWLATLGPSRSALAEPTQAGPQVARAAADEQGTHGQLESHGQLEREVAKLAAWVEDAGGTLGLYAVELGSDRVLASHAADHPMNPASNMKLITVATALDRLGPSFRFQTGLYGRLRNGKLDPLVIRGRGDPSLRTADLWRLAAALAQSGLHEVGTILVDQSYFDDQFIPPAFEQQPNEWAVFRAPVSAIALDENTVTLHVVAEQSGKPASLWFEPPGFVTVEGQVATHAPGSGQAVTLGYVPSKGRLVAKVGGYVAQGLPRLRFPKRVDDPRLLPGFVLAHLLGELGVKVQGDVHLGGADVKHRLVFHQSEPLGQLLPHLGKESNNFYAETLLKVLGATKTTPATSGAGAEVLVAWLREQNALEKGTRIVNGSGLFDANRLSARSLTRVLTTVYEKPLLYPEYLSCLAIGGVDGTLHSRLKNLGKSRRVRAKTGTLNDVDALSGYVLGAFGKGIAFSMMVNGVPGRHAAVRQRFDALVEKLAELPQESKSQTARRN